MNRAVFNGHLARANAAKNVALAAPIEAAGEFLLLAIDALRDAYRMHVEAVGNDGVPLFRETKIPTIEGRVK